MLCPLHAPDEYTGRDRLSPDFYDESETDPGAEELPARIFVALFDYDPLTMSPNPDAAEEELPFKEGQIIKVVVWCHGTGGRDWQWRWSSAHANMDSSSPLASRVRGDGSGL